MSKIIDNVKKIFFGNYFVISFVFLIFLKPYFLSFNYISNLICNIFLILFSAIIYFYSFYKNKISKYQKILIAFLLFSLISTITVSKDYSAWIKIFIKISSISLYTEILIKENLEKFLFSTSVLLYVLIFLTFITTLIVPLGIFGNEMTFLGYDNSTIILLIFGAMFILFSTLYFYKKNKNTNRLCLLYGLMPMIMVFAIYVIRWSVGALIGCLTILAAILLYLAIKDTKFEKTFYKFMDLKKLFIVSVVIFILVVVLGFQKYFSFILVNIFNKDITLTNRTYIWDWCFQIIKDYPLFGTGIFNYETRLELYGIYHAHSNFLNIVLESGIVGLGIYLYIWKFIIKSVQSAPKDVLSFIITITLFSFLIMTIIDVIDNSELLYVFLVLAYFLPYISDNLNRGKDNKLKNILIIVDSGQPIPAINGGAIETLVDSLIKENEKNKKYNIEVYSAYDKSLKEYFKKEKYVNYYYINNNSLSYFIRRCFNFLCKKIFKNKIKNLFASFVLDELEIRNKYSYYDKIIIQNAPTMIIELKKKVDAEYILHVHNDIDNLDYRNKSFDMYSKIVCCSTFVANRIKTVSSNENIITVYNGVTVEELIKFNNSEKKEKLRKKYNIPSDSIVFGYCGRLCEDKGTKELIEAFKKVAANNKDIFLVLTGNSFFKNSNTTPYIESLIECSKGYEDKIIFTGYFDHSEIGKFYSMIDVYVQPSIVNEACPLTIIESQIMNKIMLTTDSGGIPELIKNNNVRIISREKLLDDIYGNMENIIQNYEELKNIKITENVINFFDESVFATNFFKEID